MFFVYKVFITIVRVSLTGRALRGAMERSMQRMNENIKNALRAMPTNASEEEQQMMRDLLRESARLEQMRKEIRRKD